jgi:uncharacterized membrane protein (DUF373 family)
MFLIAITAVTRKIVILDIKSMDPIVLIGLALLIGALSWGYVQIIRKQKTQSDNTGN